MNPIPISKPYFDSREIRIAESVIRSGWVGQGRRVQEFEEKIRGLVGSKYAVAVNSGTVALHLALHTIGIGKGDEVIVPSFSFIATANAVVYCGARPVFVDIGANGYNIDPEKIEECIKNEYAVAGNKKALVNVKTGGILKAVMPVHQFGFPADMDRILDIAVRHKLTVIEDAACALGAKYKKRPAGSIGLAGCFSFHPRKVTTTAEGGAITTNDKKIAGLSVKLRNHGVNPAAAGFGRHSRTEGYGELGYNYRMSDLHAAIGIAQMAKLREIIRKRGDIAGRYDAAFAGIADVSVPYVSAHTSPVYQSYVLRIEETAVSDRDALIARLKNAGISTRPGNQAIHLEPYYVKNFGRRSLPMTERALRDTISLPIYPDLSVKEQNRVISKVIECLRRD